MSTKDKRAGSTRPILFPLWATVNVRLWFKFFAIEAEQEKLRLRIQELDDEKAVISDQINDHLVRMGKLPARRRPG